VLLTLNPSYNGPNEPFLEDQPHVLARQQTGPRYRHTAGEAEPYETIAVEKLTPIIGAEISGVDLGRLVSEQA
jgi:hypothetical protein